MSSLNKVILIGNLVQDIELKQTDKGSIGLLVIATNRRYKNTLGDIIEETEYHRCVAYGQIAEILNQYTSKGRKLYIEGRLKTRKWEDNQGQIRYTTEIIVENFLFLDSKKEKEEKEEFIEKQIEEDLPF